MGSIPYAGLPERENCLCKCDRVGRVFSQHYLSTLHPKRSLIFTSDSSVASVPVQPTEKSYEQDHREESYLLR